MARVFIPPQLRSLADGHQQCDVEGKNVRQVIENLEARFPGIKSRLCQGNQLLPGLSVSVGGSVSSLGLLQTVEPHSEIHFLPAIGGG